MEELKNDIINLIERIETIKKEQNEEKVDEVMEKIITQEDIGKELNKTKDSVEKQILEIAQQKEKIITDLENKKSMLEDNMSLNERDVSLKLEMLKKEQELLTKRISGIEDTIKNLEFLNLTKNEEYAVLLDNKLNSEKEFNQNELEIESLEIPNQGQVLNKINELLEDVTNLSMENIENTNLRGFVFDDIVIEESNKQEDINVEKAKEEIKPEVKKETQIESAPEAKKETKIESAPEAKKETKIESVPEVKKETQQKIKRVSINELAAEKSQKDINDILDDLSLKVHSKGYIENTEIIEPEPVKNEPVLTSEINISAKDNFVYVDSKEDKWNLETIVKDSKDIMKGIVSQARELGFSKEDISKIKRDSNPVIGFVLNSRNDPEALKRYLIGVTGVVDKDRKAPFKLKYDLTDSTLNKKTLKFLNSFAKKETNMEGVEVKGAKYNILEKIKYSLFNSNLSLGEVKDYDKEIKDVDVNTRQSFLESIKVGKEEKNMQIAENSIKADKTIEKLSKLNTNSKREQKNTKAITRDNLMVQQMKKDQQEKSNNEDR